MRYESQRLSELSGRCQRHTLGYVKKITPWSAVTKELTSTSWSLLSLMIVGKGRITNRKTRTTQLRSVGEKLSSSSKGAEIPYALERDLWQSLAFLQSSTVLGIATLCSSLDFLLLRFTLSLGVRVHVNVTFLGDGVDLLALGLSSRLGLVSSSLGCRFLAGRLSRSGGLGCRLVGSGLGRGRLLAGGLISGSLGGSGLSSGLGRLGLFSFVLLGLFAGRSLGRRVLSSSLLFKTRSKDAQRTRRISFLS